MSVGNALPEVIGHGEDDLIEGVDALADHRRRRRRPSKWRLSSPSFDSRDATRVLTLVSSHREGAAESFTAEITKASELKLGWRFALQPLSELLAYLWG
jgi:hypothetical protein